MQERKINLEQIVKTFELENTCKFYCSDTTHHGQFPFYVDTNPVIKKLLLEFGKQLLELAAENAEYETEGYYDEYLYIWIDKQSILDVIKQVG